MPFMPFGKFKGHAVEDLPDAYIVWLVGLDLREPLRGAVIDEIARRGLGRWRHEDRVHALGGPPPELREPVRAIVRAGFRTLTREKHPDTGGTNAAMRAVLAAHAWLKKAVGA
jgi:hypothetical protein